MKKILFAAVALLMVYGVMASPGRTDKESRRLQRKERREDRKESWEYQVTEATRQQFEFDFPDATSITWKQGNFEEALFLDGTVLKTAYYDYDSELVGTTTDVEVTALPENAQKKIARFYPGYQIEKLVLYDDNESNDTDMRLFSKPIAGDDNYFALLKCGTRELIVQVSPQGDVSYFSRLK